jgi:hypothetical protein
MRYSKFLQGPPVRHFSLSPDSIRSSLFLSLFRSLTFFGSSCFLSFLKSPHLPPPFPLPFPLTPTHSLTPDSNRLFADPSPPSKPCQPCPNTTRAAPAPVPWSLPSTRSLDETPKPLAQATQMLPISSSRTLATRLSCRETVRLFRSPSCPSSSLPFPTVSLQPWLTL